MNKRAGLFISILGWLSVQACFELPPNFFVRDEPEGDLGLIPTLTIYDSKESSIDGMVQVFIPAGKFLMGSENELERDCFPLHTVYLDAFWIDQTEVTNGQYLQCVNSGACTPPTVPIDNGPDSLYDTPEFQNHPVDYVSWFQARDYCQWAGRRLPTEAEWEKAARGTDGQKYPWGEESPSRSRLNYRGTYGQINPLGGPVPVGSYPIGVSPYGALDMSGNMLEWVADWYQQFYYQRSERINPQGPEDGVERILRGSSWDTYDIRIPLWYRQAIDSPKIGYSGYGFRCAQEETDS